MRCRSRDCAETYRGLRSLARPVVRGGNVEIAGTLEIDRVRDRTIDAALRIFSDSGLVEAGEDDESRFIRFLEVSGRIEMERNERYAEGEATREAFSRNLCELCRSRRFRNARACAQLANLSLKCPSPPIGTYANYTAGR